MRLLMTSGLLLMVGVLACTPAIGKKQPVFPKELTALKGSVIYVQSELQKYSLTTCRAEAIPKTYPFWSLQSINGGSRLLVGNYELSQLYLLDQALKLTEFYPLQDKIETCAYTEEKLIYLTKIEGAYRLVWVDLKNELRQVMNHLKGKVCIDSGISATRNSLFYEVTIDERDLSKRLLYQTNYQNGNWSEPRFVIAGSAPAIREDGQRLACVQGKNRQLVIYDLKQQQLKQTNLKKVSQVAWINNTDYLIYTKWNYKVLADFIELGIVNYRTGRKEVILEISRGGLRSGLAWVNF